jgi:hypothetical protein
VDELPIAECGRAGGDFDDSARRVNATGRAGDAGFGVQVVAASTGCGGGVMRDGVERWRGHRPIFL